MNQKLCHGAHSGATNVFNVICVLQLFLTIVTRKTDTNCSPSKAGGAQGMGPGLQRTSGRGWQAGLSQVSRSDFLLEVWPSPNPLHSHLCVTLLRSAWMEGKTDPLSSYYFRAAMGLLQIHPYNSAGIETLNISLDLGLSTESEIQLRLFPVGLFAITCSTLAQSELLRFLIFFFSDMKERFITEDTENMYKSNE